MSKGAAVVVALALLIAGVSIVRAEGYKRGARIAEANERAALDTTRITLIDSVAAATRLAVQARIIPDSVSDALAEALSDRDAALVAIQRSTIAFDSLVKVGQRPTVEVIEIEPETGDSIRVATFEHEGPPIEGEQTVRVGPEITLDSRLRVSPFTVGFGLACADRAPVFTWDTPEWVHATFQSGTVDPVVCDPPSPGLFSIDVGSGLWFGAGVVTTLLIMIVG